eukprot:1157023-Rhodomonas_salina.3
MRLCLTVTAISAWSTARAWNRNTPSSGQNRKEKKNVYGTDVPAHSTDKMVPPYPHPVQVTPYAREMVGLLAYSVQEMRRMPAYICTGLFPRNA